MTFREKLEVSVGVGWNREKVCQAEGSMCKGLQPGVTLLCSNYFTPWDGIFLVSEDIPKPQWGPGWRGIGKLLIFMEEFVWKFGSQAFSGWCVCVYLHVQGNGTLSIYPCILSPSPEYLKGTRLRSMQRSESESCLVLERSHFTEGGGGDHSDRKLQLVL